MDNTIKATILNTRRTLVPNGAIWWPRTAMFIWNILDILESNNKNLTIDNIIAIYKNSPELWDIIIPDYNKIVFDKYFESANWLITTFENLPWEIREKNLG
jgi:hypothetical protein